MKMLELVTRRARGEVEPRQVVRTDAEWRSQLRSDQYKVLRSKGTEAPFSGEYVHAGADGVYRCAAWDGLLFDTAAQFDSGTGWPSFSEPSVAEAVELRRDRGLGMARTEVLCRRCGGHLGHVFDDGPGPNGKRYCINSVCLTHSAEA
jgi:peptide-methionine (R)-S-oxide reductase